MQYFHLESSQIINYRSSLHIINHFDSLIIIGAFFPGIKVVQITISIFFKVSLINLLVFLKSSEASFAYPPSVSRFSDPSTIKTFHPNFLPAL